MYYACRLQSGDGEESKYWMHMQFIKSVLNDETKSSAHAAAQRLTLNLMVLGQPVASGSDCFIKDGLMKSPKQTVEI